MPKKRKTTSSTASSSSNTAAASNAASSNAANAGAASEKSGGNGRQSSYDQARQVFAQAARLYERLSKERNDVLQRLSEVDAVLAQLPSGLRGGPSSQSSQGGSKAPTGSAGQSAPKRRGRPPKSASASSSGGAGSRASSSGGRTVRQIVEAELGKGRALSWAELEKLVKSERPDVKSGSISSMIQVLREKGIVKVTGEPRQYQYSLAST